MILLICESDTTSEVRSRSFPFLLVDGQHVSEWQERGYRLATAQEQQDFRANLKLTTRITETNS